MSKTLTIGNKHYCVFCGNEIQPTVTEDCTSYNCTCQDAIDYSQAEKTAFQLQLEAMKIMSKAPKPRFGLKTICAQLSEIDNEPDEHDYSPDCTA